jgi:uncharacterized membrane protein (Fun14 family)
LTTDLFTPISATIGGGFFAGVLPGYELEKLVKLLAIIVGLFIGGLAYLQYQQVASIDWNRIEVLIRAALGNLTAHLSNSQEATALAMPNFGIPLTGSMSAGLQLAL